MILGTTIQRGSFPDLWPTLCFSQASSISVQTQEPNVWLVSTDALFSFLKAACIFHRYVLNYNLPFSVGLPGSLLLARSFMCAAQIAFCTPVPKARSITSLEHHYWHSLAPVQLPVSVLVKINNGVDVVLSVVSCGAFMKGTLFSFLFFSVPSSFLIRPYLFPCVLTISVW